MDCTLCGKALDFDKSYRVSGSKEGCYKECHRCIRRRRRQRMRPDNTTGKGHHANNCQRTVKRRNTEASTFLGMPLRVDPNIPTEDKDGNPILGFKLVDPITGQGTLVLCDHPDHPRRPWPLRPDIFDTLLSELDGAPDLPHG